MLHLHLIKSKRKRFFLGFAEYLILSFILCFPCLAYINKFMPLPSTYRRQGYKVICFKLPS